MKHVKFTDAEHTEIAAVFGGPQDPAEHENLADVQDDDERFLEYVAKMPEAFRASVLAM